VSYFANNYPEYGVPEIVELYVTTSKVLDETKRVKKAQDKRAEKEAAYQEKMKVWKLEQAKIELEKAQKHLASLEKEKTDNEFTEIFDRVIGNRLVVNPSSGDQ
jgi:hypothetical protein